jgi:hypothetical protein
MTIHQKHAEWNNRPIDIEKDNSFTHRRYLPDRVRCCLYTLDYDRWHEGSVCCRIWHRQPYALSIRLCLEYTDDNRTCPQIMI